MSKSDPKYDDDGNLKTVAEAFTVENVNVIAPLAVTIADSAAVPLGAVGNVAWVSGNGTVIALLKAIHGQLVIANGLLDDIKTNTGV